MTIYNLSDYVLDIVPDNGETLQATPPDTSSSLLPTPADILEATGQADALSLFQAPLDGEVFLPVGGQVTVTLTSDQSASVYIQLDPVVSAANRAAELLSSYIADNIPEDSLRGYYGNLADCLNDGQDLWQSLKQQSVNPIDVLNNAFQTKKSCTALQTQVTNAVSGSDGEAKSDTTSDDESSWESTLEDVVSALHEAEDYGK
jgi:hypothetical protein